MFEIKNNTPLKQLLVPSSVVVAMITVLILGGNFLYGRVTELREELAIAQSAEAKLVEKLSFLQEFELQSANISGKISQAIPADNPSLPVISQIRLKAASFGVTVDNINVGRSVGDVEELPYVDLSFDVKGGLGNTLAFVDALKNTSPLGEVEKITVSDTGDGANASITYRTYFADFPSTIPSPADPIAGFSDEEKVMIQRLVNLESASGGFLEVSPSAPTTRDNPFDL